MLRIPTLFILSKDPFIQLASALTMDRRSEPVDTKISGDIIPVGVKIRYNDHLAETLQHQRKKEKDDDDPLGGDQAPLAESLQPDQPAK